MEILNMCVSIIAQGHTANHQPGLSAGFSLPTPPKKTHNQLYLLKNKQIQLTKPRNPDLPQISLFILSDSYNKIKHHKNQYDI